MAHTYVKCRNARPDGAGRVACAIRQVVEGLGGAVDMQVACTLRSIFCCTALVHFRSLPRITLPVSIVTVGFGSYTCARNAKQTKRCDGDGFFISRLHTLLQDRAISSELHAELTKGNRQVCWRFLRRLFRLFQARSSMNIPRIERLFQLCATSDEEFLQVGNKQ